MSAFHDYVRGVTDTIPAGYSAAGMNVYRHLVFLGASQLLDAAFPSVRTTLGETAWCELMQAFIRQSRWDSHFYGDLKDEFVAFLERESI